MTVAFTRASAAMQNDPLIIFVQKCPEHGPGMPLKGNFIVDQLTAKPEVG